MAFFSGHGNLPMCRYLLVLGADCRKRDPHGSSPMHWAAHYGHVEVRQWLSQDGGAHEDIRTLDNVGDAPLRLALRHGHMEVGRWLLRQRALSPRDTGVIDDATMRNDLSPYYDSYPKWNEDHRVSVLAWALDAITTHDNVKLFLTGTLVSASSCRRYPKNEYATRSHKRMKVVLSPLVLFQGKSGILELVAAYVEPKPKPHEFHLFRQLIEHLPAFIARTSPSSSYLHKKENSIRNTDNARGEE